MSKQMPGYESYQDKLTAAQQATEEKRAAKTEKKKQEKLKKAQEKLITKKRNIIARALTSEYPKYAMFLMTFFSVQIVGFILGSAHFAHESFWDNHYQGTDENWDPIYYNSSYDNMSYGQALKNAYDFRKLKDGNIDFQIISELIITILALGLGVGLGLRTANEKKEAVKETLSKLEQLKDYGIDANQLIKDLTPSINKILESLSKIDRGYFDNLAKGGLDKANYETCVAIVSGYLKSHPKEYNNIIAIIDEATLPEAIKKKYGRGKTISFAAAQAMQFEK